METAKANNDLTKAEAINAMAHGAKVTHRFFEDYEYMYTDPAQPNKICTEDGYAHYQEEFWKYRIGPTWETGWSIWSH